jgi:hypothetical protein
MSSSLTQFFYLLMRDYLPTGKVEECMQQVRSCAGLEVRHSAPDLEAYAMRLATEMRALESTVRTTDPEKGGRK